MRVRLHWLGFRRKGKVVTNAHERIGRDFVRGSMRISSGWDALGGHALLANVADGDVFLRGLA